MQAFLQLHLLHQLLALDLLEAMETLELAAHESMAHQVEALQEEAQEDMLLHLIQDLEFSLLGLIMLKIGIGREISQQQNFFMLING